MAVTTELVLARHGEANNNATGTVGGERGCTGLSPQGREQAQRLALRLAHAHAEQPFDAFYGTPRRRVRDTAEIIGQPYPWPLLWSMRCAARPRPRRRRWPPLARGQNRVRGTTSTQPRPALRHRLRNLEPARPRCRSHSLILRCEPEQVPIRV